MFSISKYNQESLICPEWQSWILKSRTEIIPCGAEA